MTVNVPQCFGRFDDDLRACQGCVFRVDCWVERQSRTLNDGGDEE